jgi:hypothetical protein
VAGPEYLLDVAEFGAGAEHLVELAWHPGGTVEMVSGGGWSAAELREEFVERCERFTPAGEGPIVLRAAVDDRRLHLHLLFSGDLLRAVGPGVPGAGPTPFLLARSKGRAVRFVAVLETAASPGVRAVRATGEVIEVERPGGVDRHVRTDDGWEVTSGSAKVPLRGRRRAPEVRDRPLIDPNRRTPPRALAPHLPAPTDFDEGFEGFPDSDPLILDHEDQYRRSEEPYAGAEEFAARALAGWADQSLYLAVSVATPSPVLRPSGAPPLLLDNDPDDVHSDGLQIYVRPDPAGPVYGFLVVPDPEAGTVRVHGAGGTAGDAGMVTGASQWTGDGYSVTLAIRIPDWDPRTGDELGFDLLVNRMEPDRDRRAGQLVWSGGGGWVYLRGDRQDPAAFGVLELG